MLVLSKVLCVCLAVVSFPLAAEGKGGTAGRSQSRPAAAADNKGLDQARIHDVYNDGDFDEVVSLIEAFTRTHASYSKDDSIFIAKHLAVVYTANPATREKGKGYMFKLLDLLPSAKIVDMFVSDEIDHIFEKVREEFVVRQEMLGRNRPSAYESHQYAAGKMTVNGPDSAAARSPKPAAIREESHALYWVMGGTAVLAAGVAAYYLLPAKPKDKEYDIDPH